MKKYIFLMVVVILVSFVSAQEITLTDPGVDNRRVINLDVITAAISNFLDLLDTPSTYSGFGGDCVLVNPGETGLIFGNCSNATGGGGSGDITAVNTDGPYLIGGTVTGDADLFVDTAVLNSTIRDNSINQTEADLLYLNLSGTNANQNIDIGDNNLTSNWFFGLFNWTTLTNWLSFDGATLSFNDTKQNESIRDLSLNQTEADLIYLNLSGTNANQNVDIGQYNLTTPKVSLDELAFPNASFKAIVTNDLVNGTAYGVYMNGQTGTNKPTFWIQPGGPGQASGIARTFLIVNELDSLQNTTNITSCSAWADVAGEILQIDCNTSTSGADLIVGDDAQIFGDMWLKDSDGEWHFLTRELTIIDELLSNTMSNIVDYSVSGNTFVINDTTGESFTVTIGRNFTILTQSNDSVGLNVGTDLDPQFNYISYKNATIPVLTADTSEPAGDKVHVASLLIGASGSNVYGLVDRFSHDDQFVREVYERFFDQGSLYTSGFLPGLNTTRINISSGTFGIMLDKYTTTLTRDSADDGFFYVNSSGQFIQATDLSEITQYSDGTAIGNNKMVNVVWGLVPINLTEVRIMVVIQDFPGSGNEYVNVDLAEADRFGKTNIFPSDTFLKKIFVPVARTVFRKGTDKFQTLTDGALFLDLRGSSGGLGGSPPSPSITDHGDLDGLADDDHTQYLLANGSRPLTGFWQTGEFDINGTGDSRIYGANQTMFDKLISNFLIWGRNFFTLQNGWITNSTTQGINITNVLINERLFFGDNKTSGNGRFINSTVNDLSYHAVLEHQWFIQGMEKVSVNTNGLTIGSGEANKDYRLVIDGEDNDFLLEWLEDENRARISDNLLFLTFLNLMFRDPEINMSSPNDGELLLNADGNITLTAPLIRVTENLTVDKDIVVIGKQCFNADCSSFIFNNGTDLIGVG